MELHEGPWRGDILYTVAFFNVFLMIIPLNLRLVSGFCVV